MATVESKIEKARAIASQYENSAGRILVVLKRLLAMPDEAKAMQGWISALNCRNAAELYARLTELQEQYCEVMEFVKATEADDYYLMGALRKAETALIPQSFPEGMAPHKSLITDGVLITFETIARNMSQDGVLSNDQIGEIRQRLEALRTAVVSSGLPKQINGWLLDLIRLALEGLSRYEIRGVRGLRADLFVLAGELHTFYAKHGRKPPARSEEDSAAKQTGSGVFQQFEAFLDFYNRLTLSVLRTHDAAPVLAVAVERALGFLTGGDVPT